MYDYIMNRESLKRHCEKMCKKFKRVPESGVYGEHRLVLDLLEQTEWIPVSERLPEEETDVLVCNANGDIDIASGSYSTEINEFIWYISGWRFGEVIAWMPLPEPYKLEKEVE